MIDGAGVAGGAVVTNISILQWNGGSSLSSRNTSIILTNGARMYVNGDVRLGATYYSDYTTATNNTIIVVGGTADSIFSGNGAGTTVYVGYGDRPGPNYNRVLAGAGGMVTNVGNIVVGYAGNNAGTPYTPAHDNSLVVTNSGKVYSVGNITVGYGNVGTVPAQANALQLANGGQLFTSADSYIGRAAVANSTSINSTASIGTALNGTNALWNLGGKNLTVGSAVSGATANSNSLAVTAGGVLTNSSLITVGNSAGAQYNSVIVSNGAIYSTGLTIGSTSSNNTVTLWNGARWDLGGGNVVMGATNNSLAVNGGMMTNINILTVPASSALLLGSGGQIFANTVTNAGLMNVAIDSRVAPSCGCLTVAGTLKINTATLNLTVTGMGVGAHVIAKYGSLPGQFAATNGLPLGGRIDYTYGTGSQIAILVPAKGAVITIR